MNETITLELEPGEVQLVLMGLAELPLKLSGKLFPKIQGQANKPKPEPAG